MPRNIFPSLDLCNSVSNKLFLFVHFLPWSTAMLLCCLSIQNIWLYDVCTFNQFGCRVSSFHPANMYYLPIWLEGVLNTRWVWELFIFKDVLKKSLRCVCKTSSSRRLANTSWRCLDNFWEGKKIDNEDLLKTPLTHIQHIQRNKCFLGWYLRLLFDILLFEHSGSWLVPEFWCITAYKTADTRLLLASVKTCRSTSLIGSLNKLMYRKTLICAARPCIQLCYFITSLFSSSLSQLIFRSQSLSGSGI